MAASSVRADKPDPLVVVRRVADCLLRAVFWSLCHFHCVVCGSLCAYPIFARQFLLTHI